MAIISIAADHSTSRRAGLTTTTFEKPRPRSRSAPVDYLSTHGGRRYRKRRTGKERPSLPTSIRYPQSTKAFQFALELLAYWLALTPIQAQLLTFS
jgi:hypothetical protein